MSSDQAFCTTENGARVEMNFVAAGDVELHTDLAKGGGKSSEQSSSETQLCEICARATGHLVTAFQANQRGTFETLGVLPPAAGSSLRRRHGSGKPSGSRQLCAQVVLQGSSGK
jgi:hypothetical protein